MRKKETNNVKWRTAAPVALAGLLFCALLGGVGDEANGGGYFLVDGAGLEGTLEIGRPAPRNSEPEAGGWYRFEETPLYFKEAEGRVALILCAQFCLTNRNISIGSRVKEVLRRYGSPLEEKLLNGRAFLFYRGVGFVLSEDRQTVEAIYIFPVF